MAYWWQVGEEAGLRGCLKQLDVLEKAAKTFVFIPLVKCPLTEGG